MNTRKNDLNWGKQFARYNNGENNSTTNNNDIHQTLTVNSYLSLIEGIDKSKVSTPAPIAYERNEEIPWLVWKNKE